MTRLLITSPDAAAHSAKNAPTAPGPHQPGTDSKGIPMVGEVDRALMVKTRERALKGLRRSRDEMTLWVDLVRQDAEIRQDSFEFDDVATDPAYARALELYAQMTAAIAWFAHSAPAIEAGEYQ